MKRSLLWRGLLILAVAAFSFWQTFPPKEKINLGLDLQGGIHLVLGVQTQDAVRAETDKDMEVLRREADSDGITGLTTKRIADTGFEAAGVGARVEALEKTARDWLGNGWTWTQQEDRFVFTMKSANEKSIRDSAVNQALQTIRNRIDQFGVSEPLIARQGLDSERIVVQLPGIDDPDRVKRLIKNTAFLEFRLCDYPWNGLGASSPEEILQHYGGKLPDEVEIFPEVRREPTTGRVVSQTYYAVQKRRVVTGRDLRSANPSQGQLGQPVVQFMFSADGARAFGEATGANIGRGLAIVLDGEIRSAPSINSRITDSGIIEGNFTQQEVQDLVTTLRSGALPASIVYLEDRTVGPSLGADSIRRGIEAGVVGAAAIVLAMLAIYRGAGVNAILMLALNVLVIFGGLAAFGATLTLPGIAGIVLTFGMAVDANVLVFERIKEELRLGKSIRAAVDAGFDRAFAAIIDTHLTALISALFLFQFGTGPVRGFAVTLSIGILGTLFSMVFGSRWLFDATVLRRRQLQKISI